MLVGVTSWRLAGLIIFYHTYDDVSRQGCWTLGDSDMWLLSDNRHGGRTSLTPSLESRRAGWRKTKIKV